MAVNMALASIARLIGGAKAAKPAATPTIPFVCREYGAGLLTSSLDGYLPLEARRPLGETL